MQMENTIFDTNFTNTIFKFKFLITLTFRSRELDMRYYHVMFNIFQWYDTKDLTLKEEHLLPYLLTTFITERLINFYNEMK